MTSIVIVTAPTNGSVVVNVDGTVTYTHDGSETTSDTFEYTIKDNGGTVLTSNTATVNVLVTPVNDVPVATDSAVTGTEDTDYIFAWTDFNISDVDTNINDSTAVQITSLPID